MDHAPPPPPRRSILGHPELWLGILVFVAGAYFCNSGSWNQNARLDAIFSFVEPGPHRWTFRIDDFLPAPGRAINTGDWTRAGEHYYANKAPGTIFLGVLAYAPLYLLEVRLGANVSQPMLEILNAYWINLCVSVLPLSLASAIWYRSLQRRLPPPRAAAVVLSTFFGTALFPYATQLWGHTTAAAFVMLAFGAFERGPGTRGRGDVWTGGFAGLAVLCDFLALPAALALSLGVGLRRRAGLPWLALGAAGPLTLLLGYQWYCFGSPWALPTEGTRAAFVDESRVLGLFGGVDPHAVFELTFGSFRGLFFHMPILLVALWGYVVWWRRAPRTVELWVSLAAFVASLTLVASFNGWHGGATVCARYLIPAIPLLARALAELPADRKGTVLLGLSALPSVLNMLAVAAVGPVAPDRLQNPLLHFVYPRLASGRLHPYPLPIRLQVLHPDFAEWGHQTVWNFGDVFGLSGLWRLLPLLVIVCLASLGLAWASGSFAARHARSG